MTAAAGIHARIDRSQHSERQESHEHQHQPDQRTRQRTARYTHQYDNGSILFAFDLCWVRLFVSGAFRLRVCDMGFLAFLSPVAFAAFVLPLRASTTTINNNTTTKQNKKERQTERIRARVGHSTRGSEVGPGADATWLLLPKEIMSRSLKSNAGPLTLTHLVYNLSHSPLLWFVVPSVQFYVFAEASAAHRAVGATCRPQLTIACGTGE